MIQTTADKNASEENLWPVKHDFNYTPLYTSLLHAKKSCTRLLFIHKDIDIYIGRI